MDPERPLVSVAASMRSKKTFSIGQHCERDVYNSANKYFVATSTFLIALIEIIL